MARNEESEFTAPQLLMTTQSEIPGHRIQQVIGLVYGITVRTRGVGGKIMASLRGLVGGEMGAFVELANEIREQAVLRLNEVAYQRGANAIVGIRFDSNDMSTSDQFSGTEVCAYGTAVVVDPI